MGVKAFGIPTMSRDRLSMHSEEQRFQRVPPEGLRLFVTPRVPLRTLFGGKSSSRIVEILGGFYIKSLEY